MSYNDVSNNLYLIQTIQENSAQSISTVGSITSKGSLMVGDGSKSSTLDSSTGNDGDVLVLDSSKDIGISWVIPNPIANTAVTPGSYTVSNLEVNNLGQVIDASNGSVDINDITPTLVNGDLLVRNSQTLTRFPIGSQGRFLSVNSSTPTGLLWDTININNINPTTTKGDLLVQGLTEIEKFEVGINNDNKFLISDSSQPLGLKYGKIVDISPTTSLGDIMVYNNTNLVDVLSIGGSTDGDVLTSDSTNLTLGLSWKPVDINNYTPTTTKGDILVYNNSNLLSRFACSNIDNDVLTVNTGMSITNLEWKTVVPASPIIQYTMLLQSNISGEDWSINPYLSDSQVSTWDSSISNSILWNFPFPVTGIMCLFIMSASSIISPSGITNFRMNDNTGLIISGTDTSYNIDGLSNITDGKIIYMLDTPYPANTDFGISAYSEFVGNMSSRLTFYVIH